VVLVAVNVTVEAAVAVSAFPIKLPVTLPCTFPYTVPIVALPTVRYPVPGLYFNVSSVKIKLSPV
jgi:hypothetical protein